MSSVRLWLSGHAFQSVNRQAGPKSKLSTVVPPSCTATVWMPESASSAVKLSDSVPWRASAASSDPPVACAVGSSLSESTNRNQGTETTRLSSSKRQFAGPAPKLQYTSMVKSRAPAGGVRATVCDQPVISWSSSTLPPENQRRKAN